MIKLTLREWMDMQKNNYRVCDKQGAEIPEMIFIGVMDGDGTICLHIKLVAKTEWNKYQEVWEEMSGVNSANKQKIPRKASQFFLICN